MTREWYTVSTTPGPLTSSLRLSVFKDGNSPNERSMPSVFYLVLHLCYLSYSTSLFPVLFLISFISSTFTSPSPFHKIYLISLFQKDYIINSFCPSFGVPTLFCLCTFLSFIVSSVPPPLRSIGQSQGYPCLSCGVNPIKFHPYTYLFGKCFPNRPSTPYGPCRNIGP